MHRMMADSGEGESGEEGNEEDYTNQNKDGRVDIEKVHPPTTWSTFAAVPLAWQVSSSSIVQGRESEGTFALDDHS